MNGKLGNESLGEFKLGDALLEGGSSIPSGAGGLLIKGIPRRREELDEEELLAFVLTQV